VEERHGRFDERRRCTPIRDADDLLYIRGTAEGSVGPGLSALVRVEAERRAAEDQPADASLHF